MRRRSNSFYHRVDGTSPRVQHLEMSNILLVFLIAFALQAAACAQTLRLRQPAKPVASSNPAPAPEIEAPSSVELPRGISLQVEIPRQYPMKRDEPIQGTLLHPLFVDGKLVISKGAKVRGKIVGLEPDNKARLHARLLGDFTPFHRPQVQFDEIELSGESLFMKGETVTNGAPVLQLSTPGAAPKKSLVAREVAKAKADVHDRIAWFTAPGFKDRAMQMLYHQLPYHPESIAAHTAWSFELAEPLNVPSGQISAPPSSAAAPPAVGKPETWSVNALLTSTITSANARPGNPVVALVVEPVYDRNQQLVVPQGSLLMGKVTKAKAARSFGRNGKLRFTFQQVRFPEGFGKPVEGSLGGATTEKTQNLQMDAEGTVTPRNESSAVAPILLTVLAGRALDEDGNMTADTGVASNGFGLVGRVVGIVAGSRNLAAGIGYYAAGLSFYENFLRTGRDVVFPKDTRIEIETTPLRAPVLRPEVR
ncbi:MAG: hypothetical protein WAM85_11495 [Terracidiphilus sp.]